MRLLTHGQRPCGLKPGRLHAVLLHGFAQQEVLQEAHFLVTEVGRQAEFALGRTIDAHVAAPAVDPVVTEGLRVGVLALGVAAAVSAFADHEARGVLLQVHEAVARREAAAIPGEVVSQADFLLLVAGTALVAVVVRGIDREQPSLRGIACADTAEEPGVIVRAGLERQGLLTAVPRRWSRDHVDHAVLGVRAVYRRSRPAQDLDAFRLFAVHLGERIHVAEAAGAYRYPVLCEIERATASSASEHG